MPKKNHLTPTKWLPSDQKIIQKWIKKLWKDIEKDPTCCHQCKKLFELHPGVTNDKDTDRCDLIPHITKEQVKSLNFHEPVEELCLTILQDADINMFFHQMFWQQVDIPAAKNNITVFFWQEFIVLLNWIMTYTPVYSDSELVGFPINALINWPMQTTAGFAAFLNSKVNVHFKEILNYWGKHLQSSASASVLHEGTGGWFSKEALEDMRGPDGESFEEQFVCDPTKPHWGFCCWDDFFIREFRKGARPLAPGLDDFDIVNACESAPFKIETNAGARSLFWIKNQPYSINYMLNNSERATYFHGGTIYQAFLSALSYHRWHSPISGTIVETELIDGSYYSQTYNIDNDPASPNMSQGYISQVAARAVIYIKADNPVIGILGFVAIGMSEVSTNQITVKPDQHVERGEQLGMFHFGGSTHCILYRPGLKVDFDLSPNTEPSLHATNIPLRRKVARVSAA